MSGENSISRIAWWRWVVPIVLGIVIWFLPHPTEISDAAWHLLAIFIATIAGIMTKPLPMGAVAIIGIAVTALTGTLTINESLSGFSNRVIWLIVMAFFISRGFIKTGLGQRIAYIFMSMLGRKTLGLAYGVVATDLILAPAIPSITARSGGVLFPVLRSIAHIYNSHPDDGTQRKIGAFLIKTSFQGTVITGAMFLTGMAANPLAVKLAGDMGVEMNWSLWAFAAVVPGLLSLLIVPFLIYKLYPPQIKETPEAAELAHDRLKEMGPMDRNEIIMLVTFILLLFLWIYGRMLNLHSATAAFTGLVVLLVTGVLTWDDILHETGAWNTLIWFAALVMMASYLNHLGLIPWVGDRIGQLLTGFPWMLALLILALVYFYSHYFFASSTAHVSSMYLPFLAVALSVGAPPLLSALILAYFSNLFGSITHYGTGPAPVLFGSGFVEMKDWWRLGGIISVVNIIIWLGIGGAWWKIIGIW